MKNKKVFVDADALVALVRVKDGNHKKAKKIYKKLVSKGVDFIISNTSLYEVVTILSQRISHDVSIRFLKEMRNGLNVVFVDKKREKNGVGVFGKQTSKNVSFCDCLNMAIMREFRIKEIFSFDKCYKTNGFVRIDVDG